MQYFWLDCSNNHCLRQSIFFALTTLLFFFNLVWLINTLINFKKIKLQILALTFNSIVNLIQIFLSMMRQNYQIDLVIDILEIYSYFLIMFTFANLKYSYQTFSNISRYNKFMLVFAMITILPIAAAILIFSFYDQITCQYRIITSSIVYGLKCIIFLFTIFYCSRFLRSRIKSQLQAQIGEDVQFINNIHFIRSKQSKIYIYSFSIAIILGAMSLISLLIDSIPIICSIQNGIQIITSNNLLGQIILIVTDISDLIPLLMIVTILVIVPIWLKRQLFEEKEGQEKLIYKKQNISQISDAKLNNGVRRQINQKNST